MSIILNRTDDKDASSAGYFRIGFVTLTIPPEDIVTTHIANNDKLSTLRGLGEMHLKTGQSRWDVVVKWTALKGEPGTADYLTQWDALTDVVAMFKVAPFVEVESPHLRQIFAPMSTERMAVALRQLRIDTHPDIVDGLTATLTMTLFNYHPYSVDFGYTGGKGQADDAQRSNAFRTYIQNWKATNGRDVPDWRGLTPGVLALRWREYLPISTGEAPPAGTPVKLSVSTPSAPTARSTPTSAGTVRKGQLPPEVERLIEKIAPKYGVPVDIAKAQALQESGGRTGATSGKGAMGVFQLMPETARELGVTDPRDLTQNITGGMKYMAQQKQHTGSWELALAAYNAGLGNVQKYGGIPPFKETQGYVANIMATATQRYGYTEATAQSATPPKAVPPVIVTASQKTPALTAPSPDVDTLRLIDVEQQDRGWTRDYVQDGMAFYYQEHLLKVAPIEAADAETIPNLFPTQLSVLFVNNLAQIPLAGYQYPTYQHIGPSSSLVSVSFESKGTRTSDDREPQHPGVSQLTSMAHKLEEQFRRLWTTFRRVSSVHRMQAVTVQNDVLNLLGVGALMLDQVTTETVSDAADLVLVNVTGSQYENIFEDTDGFAANDAHAAYRDLGLDLATDPGMYFVDYNQEYRQKVKENISGVIKTTQDVRDQFNAIEGTNVDSIVGGVQLSAGFSVTGQYALAAAVTKGMAALSGSMYKVDANNAMPTDPNEIMQMTHIPGYSMAEAFPTFKLFFMEDASLGIYHSFDNFNSYASVTDIEIIKPKDKPWTMVLQLTNLAHLLNHKLYPDTAEGRLEREYTKWDRTSSTGPNGETVGGPTAGSSVGGQNRLSGKAPYAEYGGSDGSASGSTTQAPLKYFPLQTGTKVELRIGYKSDPSKLTPVFGGTVTEIQGDEVLTITCQSFLLELVAGSAENVPTNSWWHLGTLLETGATNINPIAQLLGAGSVIEGPAYGGLHVLGHDGDAMTVIGALLQDAHARHFGHWQVNTKANFFIKGYDWIPLLGEVTDISMLKNSGDRSGENILINHSIGADGSSKPRGEAEGWNPIKPYAYYVDSKSTLSIWELIRDIARRCPEYILCEKLYGFPTSCNGTLVFGHPLDWYYSREDSAADFTKLHEADPSNAKFNEWWKTLGKSTLQNEWAEIERLGGVLPFQTLEDSIRRAKESPVALERELKDLLRAQGQLFGITVNDDDWWGAGKAFNRISELLYRGEAAVTPQNQEDRIKMFGGALQNVLRSYESYVVRHSEADLGSARIRPIRRYHLIDHNTIIHNGLCVNDKIYNAVRIGDGESGGKSIPFLANGAIPAQHVRMLDVTELINDPKRNVLDPSCVVRSLGSKSGLSMAYAQSFLKEEVGKMYRGDIVLRGVPEIEPWDVLMLFDPSTAIFGAVEVDQVIHSFNLENGYITIVKPRAVVAVNEASSAQFLNTIMHTMAITLPSIMRIGSLNGPAATIALAETGVVVGLGTYLASTALGGAAVTGAAAFFATPPGWIVAAVLCVGALGLGVMYWAGLNSENTPLVVVPVMRFNRPWVGGLQGWKVTDLIGIVNGQARQVWATEVAPIAEAAQTLYQAASSVK